MSQSSFGEQSYVLYDSHMKFEVWSPEINFIWRRACLGIHRLWLFLCSGGVVRDWEGDRVSLRVFALSIRGGRSPFKAEGIHFPGWEE